MYENIDHVKNLPKFKKNKILSDLENEINFFKKISIDKGQTISLVLFQLCGLAK